jgi:hypothetical protein
MHEQHARTDAAVIEQEAQHSMQPAAHALITRLERAGVKLCPPSTRLPPHASLAEAPAASTRSCGSTGDAAVASSLAEAAGSLAEAPAASTRSCGSPPPSPSSRANGDAAAAGCRMSLSIKHETHSDSDDDAEEEEESMELDWVGLVGHLCQDAVWLIRCAGVC